MRASGTRSSRPLRAVFPPLSNACLVAAPLALGVGTGHGAAGAAASLGAYLWTVGHFGSKRPLGWRVVAATVVLVGLAGVTGAMAGRELWLLVVLVIPWAVLQAIADTAASALRVPAAMAALCFLLSAMIAGTDDLGAAGVKGALVLGGATWMGAAELIGRRPWRAPGTGTRNVDLAGLRRAWPGSRRFASLLSVPTALSAAVAGIFDISHGAWMATTVLRVLRPDSSATVVRSERRIGGTAAGALVAAVLLGTERHALVAVIVLVVALSAMQMVGASRYGFFTFFLTLIALELGSVGEPSSWHVAVIRVILTVAGAVVAVTSGLVYDRLAPRHSSAS